MDDGDRRVSLRTIAGAQGSGYCCPLRVEQADWINGQASDAMAFTISRACASSNDGGRGRSDELARW